MNSYAPVKASVTITNLVASGAGFAVRHGTGESCYIPQTVIHAAGARAGAVVEAMLVENPHEDNRHRTPYLVTYIHPTKVTSPVQLEMDLGERDTALSEQLKDWAPKHTIEGAKKFTRETMLEGGVWTNTELFHEYMGEGADREANLPIYSAIGNTLRAMFQSDECAKWTLWRKASQKKASKDYYSCYPDSVEVAEFED